MRIPLPTTWRRRSGARLVVSALILLTLVGGCSEPARRAGPPGPVPSSAIQKPTQAPTPTPTTLPPGTARPTPSRSPREPRGARPLRDTVSTASPRQVVGLVRIVASIGSDGRGETSTGMVVRADGRVVTNNHAVAGATAVRATVLTTGRTYDARIVGADSEHDVALLHLDGATRLSRVVLARRDARVGDPVVVVGDARGLRATFTAATGTVLDRGRTLVTPDTGAAPGERLTGVLLSSCNVVAGESGGPTYDVGGRVIGMTTAAVRTRRGLFGVAIPSSTLRAVLRDLGRDG